MLICVLLARDAEPACDSVSLTDSLCVRVVQIVSRVWHLSSASRRPQTVSVVSSALIKRRERLESACCARQV
jgi:hypothetical protein